ncbi:MAG: dihydrodipicolinate synthase family protein [Chthonomonadales bacterium]
MEALDGILTAIVTPFRSSGELWLDVVPDLLAYQQAAGVDGVVVCGTNGEGPSLSVAERKALLEEVLRHRGNLRVVAATGACSLTDALELTCHAAQVGADAALVLPPFYFKHVLSEGVADYFRKVLDAASLPVYLYHIPQFSAVPVSEEVLDLLAGHPRLAGVKDSEGNWEHTEQFLARSPRLRIFAGDDYTLGRSLLAGAVGGISGTANAFPHEVVAVKAAACTNGDVEAAQKALNGAIDLVLRYRLIPANKSIMARRGLPRLHVRPPLVDLTPEEEQNLIGEVQAVGLL